MKTKKLLAVIITLVMIAGLFAMTTTTTVSAARKNVTVNFAGVGNNQDLTGTNFGIQWMSSGIEHRWMGGSGAHSNPSITGKTFTWLYNGERNGGALGNPGRGSFTLPANAILVSMDIYSYSGFRITVSDPNSANANVVFDFSADSLDSWGGKWQTVQMNWTAETTLVHIDFREDTWDSSITNIVYSLPDPDGTDTTTALLATTTAPPATTTPPETTIDNPVTTVETTTDVPGNYVIITTNELSDGVVAEVYSASLKAVGVGPVVWTVESGTLPPGLSLSDDDSSGDAVISGIPTTPGTFNFTIKAENIEEGLSDTKEFQIIIAPEIVSEKGDINGDGKVNAMDLLIMKQHILDVPGKKIAEDTPAFWAADMNDDNKINGMDLLLLKKMILK